MHDVVIIGAGPAGISAARWCDELGLDTLLLEQLPQTGGQLLHIYNPVVNHLGTSVENGHAFNDILSNQVAECDFDLWTEVEIEAVDLAAKRISLRSGEVIQAINIIIATGNRRRRLGIPGEAELQNRGVLESGARDRDLMKGKDVCVIGGGDAAVENALMLAESSATVTLVSRSAKLRARNDFIERLRGTHCLTVFKESCLLRIIGAERVEAVEILRAGAIKPFQMAVAGVLIRIGVEPVTELFRDQLAMDQSGYITIDSRSETSIPNVFAIGDVANPAAPTISSAIGMGATAAKVIASRLAYF